jgi:hypothetical protein
MRTEGEKRREELQELARLWDWYRHEQIMTEAVLGEAEVRSAIHARRAERLAEKLGRLAMPSRI